MFSSWIASIKRFGSELLQKARKWIIARTNPTKASQLLGTTSDLLRNKTELVAENALLRQPFAPRVTSLCRILQHDATASRFESTATDYVFANTRTTSQ